MAMQWQSGLGSADADWQTALSTTLANLTTSEETSLALLFVSQAHASHLREACSEVVQALSPEVLVAVVGAGVAGAGSELEGEPVFSILAGALPENTALRPFLMTSDSMPNWPSLGDSVPEGSPPSFLLFADPYSPIVQTVNCLDDAFPASVVAGGLSCPTSESAPSLALYTRGALPRVLPSGSVLGLVLGGPRLEVHTACAQGASPVGPTFTVTAGQDNLVEALDGVPALERLQQVAQEAASSDERLLRLLQRALLVGLPVRAGDGVDDFLIRQVVGATPGGGLVLGGERVVAGETQLRFFVRDEIE
jgi:small ligand-binding sensory domain FIST